MRHLSNISALTTIIILLFAPILSLSNGYQQSELAKAIQMFDKKQYDEAEKIFEKLVNERPDDFMINYFYGACRTENGHYSNHDLSYLEKASKEVSPLDIDYYFGIQYHAKGEYEKALAHYITFKETADEAELNRVNLAEKMEQCENHVNPFNWIPTESVLEDTGTIQDTGANLELTDIVEAQPILNDSPVNSTEMVHDSLFEDEINIDAPQAIVESKTEPVESKPIDISIDFSVNAEIRYNKLSNFKTPDGKEFYENASAKQKELDTILNTTKILRDRYSTEINRTVKDSIGQQILGLEGRSYELKSEINELYTESKLAENEYWDNATEDEKATFIASTNAPQIQKTTSTSTIDDTVPIEIPSMLIDNSSTTVKPSVPANKELSYKIQIGAYSRGLPTSVKRLFDKLALIRKIDNYTDDRGVVVYTTGNLVRFEDAMTMLKQVQQEGVEDAIIAAYFKGKRIPLTEAKALEGI